MDKQDHTILSCLDPFLSYLLYPRRKTIWSELELNLLHKRPLKPLDHA